MAWAVLGFGSIFTAVRLLSSWLESETPSIVFKPSVSLNALSYSRLLTFDSDVEFNGLWPAFVAISGWSGPTKFIRTVSPRLGRVLRRLRCGGTAAGWGVNGGGEGEGVTFGLAD